MSKVRVWDLLALSGELRREMVDQTCTQNKLPMVRDTLVTVPCICGTVGTISAATGETVAEGGEVGKDRVS